MASTPERVQIHYHRPPDRTEVFEQDLLERGEGCVITFVQKAPAHTRVLVQGRTVLEPNAPVIWFTFPDAWHDIGRFHDARGEFTGLYANILTPVEFETPNAWKTTDLYLDIWLGADGSLVTLDEDELADALLRGWIGSPMAARASGEVDRILRGAASGTWPPAIVHEWTLERARRVLATG